VRLHSTRDRPIPGLLLVLAILFFLSGTSALIYQVLWLRLLGLVFGVTVYAASTVWAVFMAGLAVGSVIGGRAADRVRRPLVWLGIAEALIGVTALATPFALDLLQGAYAAVHPSLNSSPVTLTIVRLAMSFAVLIVPSALMGATLPLVVKSSLREVEGLGGRVGVLYATNTAGAIGGSLLAGLVLIPRAGILRSFLIAAALNALVAVAAIALGRRLPESDLAVRATPEAPSAPTTPPLDARQILLLVIFTLSGFVSLALEVVWFRVVTLFVRPTVYGYALMLAAVLGGIAAGSYLVAPWLRRRGQMEARDWLLALGALEGGIAIASLLSLGVLPRIPGLIATAGPAVAWFIGDYLAYLTIVSFAVIMPTMLLFGAAFPIGLHAWARPSAGRTSDVATRVGLFYSLNVAGAIVGSLASGFVLIPALGTLKTLVALAALSLVSAFALLAAAPASPVVRVLSAVAMCALFAWAARGTPDPFDAYLAQRHADQTVVWQREGVQATVSVHQDRRGSHTLHVSGNHQAGGNSFVHHRIGNLPMLVHPDARQALVIGLGGGATAGALSQHTGVSVDVVELSPEVAQAAARFFRPINFDVLRKPNVRLHIDDGRNYLLLTGQRYDVVTADVILPIHAGSGNLYSAEYFRLVRRALKPGGIAVQWVAGTEAEYKTIMRTFLSVFPETTLWAGGSLMFGSVEPLRLRQADFDWKLQVPQRREMMTQLGVKTFEDLLGLYVAGPEEMRQFLGAGPVLTDDRPLVEYFLSLPRSREVDLSGVKGDVMRHVDRP
jgi:spermidine synthase